MQTSALTGAITLVGSVIKDCHARIRDHVGNSGIVAEDIDKANEALEALMQIARRAEEDEEANRAHGPEAPDGRGGCR